MEHIFTFRLPVRYGIKMPIYPQSAELSIAGESTKPPYSTFPFEWYELEYNGVILKFSVKVFGERPETGYKLYLGLHGGGTDHPDAKNNYPGGLVNNWSWSHFQNWYAKAVRDQGGAIYIAPRGVNEEWDLFETPETHVLIERLIMLMQTPFPLKHPNLKPLDRYRPLVDANRVYVAGFSAGGDGVYRLATHFADRFAAANMSAGHPGAIKLNNLCNVPMVLQVGDKDTNVDHNTITVDKAVELDKLEAAVPGYYKHTCFVHRTADNVSQGDAHWIWADSERGEAQGTAIDPASKTDLVAFRKDPLKYNKAGVLKNTSAIGLISEFIRKPLSPTLVWNLDSRPPRPGNLTELELSEGKNWRQKLFYYWLYIHDTTSPDFQPWDMSKKSRSSSDPENENNVIRVSYDKNNIKFFDEPRNYLGVLLNQGMMDLNAPINISIKNGTVNLNAVSVKPSDEIRKQTLFARGDPYYIFSAAIWFSKDTAGTWKARAAPSLFPPEKTVPSSRVRARL